MTEEDVEILYQDEDLLAVNKPSGIFVHRSDLDRRQGSLVPLVRRAIGRLVYPVHRLDRATSGVLLFGLSPEAAGEAHRALRHPKSEKCYLGLARGVTPLAGVLTWPLLDSSRTRYLFARTEYRRLAVVHRRHSLLALSLKTGRRHQIRRHLARAKHQLLGDSTYGKGRLNRFYHQEYGLPRLCLHAQSLTILHPRTQEHLEIRAPLPADLQSFLERLSQK